ncbi:MAG: radical SAM protein [Clostridia bacterium]|nr:radical SAM protein [Clostridia bacterium]
MKYEHISLVLTDRCNADCDSCSLSCGPDGRNVMAEDLMLRVVREAKAAGIRIVEFTGGEPFLFTELLSRGVQAAHGEKMGVMVTSNGFWGSWEKEKVYSLLKDMKPDHVNVSSDFFHCRFVPAEHVVQALQACRNLGISCRMLVADTEGACSAGRYMQSLGEKHFFSIDTWIYPARRCGRAMNLPEAWFPPAARRENTLTVFYDGEAYACSPHEGRAEGTRLGNVLQTPLQELIGFCEGRDVAGKEAEGDVQ